MSIDHLDRDVDDTQARAAVVIEQATLADVPGYRMRHAMDAARALDEAGLLAARDAEIRADGRAKVLAGFTEERTTFWEHDEGTARLRRPGPGIPYRRLVGPWVPVEGDA